MKRRTLLKGLGGASLAGAIAGCLGDLEDDEDPENPEDDANDNDGDDGDDDEDEAVGQSVEPEITETAIESREADSDDEDGHNVTTEDLTVRITGRITASTPCHEAVFNSVDYDEDSGELSVAIGTEDASDPDEACQQVITDLYYTATIEFVGEAPQPDAVSVTHERGGSGGDDGYDY